MGSWVDCPCGNRIHKNLFTSTGVSVVVVDDVLDGLPETFDKGDCVSKIIESSDILVRCRKCGRIAIEDGLGKITIYTPDSSHAEQVAEPDL